MNKLFSRSCFLTAELLLLINQWVVILEDGAMYMQAKGLNAILELSVEGIEKQFHFCDK